MIDVVPASRKKEFREFLALPSRIYGTDTHWVPPLVRDVKEQFSAGNPFFQHGRVMPFIARVNDETVGRVAAIFNQIHVDFHGEKTGFFGFFECVDNSAVARALFARVRHWLGEQDTDRVIGPVNFSTNEECGSLIAGFESPPMVMMPYNHAYYQDLFAGAGLRKAKDLFAYIVDVPEKLPDKVYRVSQLARQRGINVRAVNMRRFRDEMEIFKGIYNSAWEKNWGFVPMTDQEIEHLAAKLRHVMDPALTLIAEINNDPVGFLMILPDMNYVLKRMGGKLSPLGIVKALWHSRNIREGRLLLLGIRRGFRRRGVESGLFMEALKAVHKKKYRRVEFSWVLEDNLPVQRLIEMISGRLYKKYRMYEGEIS